MDRLVALKCMGWAFFITAVFCVTRWIWEENGQYGWSALTCILIALVLFLAYVSGAAKRDKEAAAAAKSNWGMGDTLGAADLLGLPDSALVEDSRGIVWQKWTIDGVGGGFPVWFRFGAIDPVSMLVLIGYGPLKLAKECTRQEHPLSMHPDSKLFLTSGPERAREAAE